MTYGTREYGMCRTGAGRTAGHDGGADRRDRLSRNTESGTHRATGPPGHRAFRRPAAVPSADGALVEYHATEIPEQ
ncbi:hypothetical protein CF54_06350 [Streptomyces sp. Tu 6176]|uniref:hypothetical protein n=1 Tax=Streptomyces sp. Tu 6176 TaxID=1470557 RepID=UPI00044625E5|nr:hypothetical protein [Streptomyces sp. Tu 6176]EYT83609.1 hypothetical protein CF54_06350 [Streptomyces sp. Tu 6176]